jgi:hypothetical protein
MNIIKSTKLFCHYPGQTESQPCYIELDCKSETLSATYNGEIGNAVPFSVWHGHDQRFGIPCLTTDAADDLMAEIAPLAEIVVAGYASEWDGNNNVARFTDEATAATEKITAICDAVEADESNSIQAWDAGDYLDNTVYFKNESGEQCKWKTLHHAIIDGVGTITAQTTDNDLGQMKTKIEDDADANVEINGLEKFLTDLRDQCKSNTETDE